MIFEAQVYSAADKYMMPALKEHASEKFGAAVAAGWSMNEFPLAVTEVYRSTPEADRELRDQIIDVAVENVQQLTGDDQFMEMMREVPGFTIDLICAMAGQKYRCLSCK